MHTFSRRIHKDDIITIRLRQADRRSDLHRPLVTSTQFLRDEPGNAGALWRSCRFAQIYSIKY